MDKKQKAKKDLLISLVADSGQPEITSRELEGPTTQLPEGLNGNQLWQHLLEQVQRDGKIPTVMVHMQPKTEVETHEPTAETSTEDPTHQFTPPEQHPEPIVPKSHLKTVLVLCLILLFLAAVLWIFG